MPKGQYVRKIRTKASEITPKEKKVADNYLTNGYNKTKAILDSPDYHPNPDSAKVQAHKVFSRPVVQNYIEEVLERQNLSPEDLAKMSFDLIKKNMQEGKGSQAVANSMIQFLYKVNNLLPTPKSVKLSIKTTLESPQTYSEMKKMLESTNEKTRLILDDLKK